MWRYPLLRFQLPLSPEMPYTLPHCTCACATPESPRWCHRYTGISSRIVSLSILHTIFEGCQGPIHPSEADGPQHMRADLSLSFPSESHRRANFTPYSQCGLLASLMASRTTRFFQIRASTRLASSVCRLAPDCSKRLTFLACTSAIIKQQHSPSLPFSSRNLSLFSRVVYMGFLTDRFLARPNFPRAPTLL
jgi:hypothetical protein